jgi:DNA-binding transcriptional MocR family regulator
MGSRVESWRHYNYLRLYRSLGIGAESGYSVWRYRGIESPTHFGLLQLLQVMGLKALELPTDAREGVNVNVLRGALAKRRIRACVLSSSFSNPLGCTMPEEKKLEVLQLLAKDDVPLIEDDIYGYLHFGAGERPRPFIALDRHDLTLYCSSFSKTLAPGYRVGWLATGRRLTQVLEAKLGSTLSSPVLPQRALAEHLATGSYSHHRADLKATLAHGVPQHGSKAYTLQNPGSSRGSPESIKAIPWCNCCILRCVI